MKLNEGKGEKRLDLMDLHACNSLIGIGQQMSIYVQGSIQGSIKDIEECRNVRYSARWSKHSAHQRGTR